MAYYIKGEEFLQGSSFRIFSTETIFSKLTSCTQESRRATGLEFESREIQEFSLLRIVQTGSGVHAASYPNGTGGAASPGVNRQGREADQSPPISVDLKKTWIYTPTPQYVFMA
jgi:hypothetical protein